METEIMTEREAVSLAFVEIAKLTEALGVSHINQLPGCWEYQVDEQWRIALNGHLEPTKCSMGMAVAPFHCYVEWGGFPAGEFHPVHGGFIAAGEAANEETLIAALKQATEKARAAQFTRRPGYQNGMRAIEEMEAGR